VATVSSLVILFVLGEMKLALSFILASASVDRIVDISGLLLCVAFIFPTTKISGAEVSKDLELARHEAERLKEEAEVANQAKSTLLANISDEICTQRNAILGCARRLRRQSGLGRKQPLDPAYRPLAGQFKRLLLVIETRYR
jgi:signal transduction histidine kinase